jgi:hypothetical protein
VKKAAPILAGLAVLAGCGRGDEAPPEGNAVTIEVPRSAADQPGVTPMAERVAVIGLLNKRNGIVRDLTLKPGQAIRVKDVVVRLRACETTAPWEREKLTGAFLQVDVQRPDENWNRVFSGWVYKESPSLNVVEHPVYDVWPKSCAMSFPAGPAAPAAPAPSASTRSSSAPNSGGGNATEPVATPPTETPAAPVPSAPESNSI